MSLCPYLVPFFETNGDICKIVPPLVFNHLNFVIRWELDKELRNSGANIYHTLLLRADCLDLNENYQLHITTQR